MSKEEIKHFKAFLRQGILRHKNILLDDKFQEELLNMIKDYEKLQNNWNELKKSLKENISQGRSKDNLWLMGCYDEDKLTLDKMQTMESNNE